MKLLLYNEKVIENLNFIFDCLYSLHCVGYFVNFNLGEWEYGVEVGIRNTNQETSFLYRKLITTDELPELAREISEITEQLISKKN